MNEANPGSPTGPPAPRLRRPRPAVPDAPAAGQLASAAGKRTITPKGRLKARNLVPSPGSLLKGLLIDAALDIGVNLIANEWVKTWKRPPYVQHIHDAWTKQLLRDKAAKIQEDLARIYRGSAATIINRALDGHLTHAVISYTFIQSTNFDEGTQSRASQYHGARISRRPFSDSSFVEKTSLLGLDMGYWSYSFSVPLKVPPAAIEAYVQQEAIKLAASGPNPQSKTRSAQPGRLARYITQRLKALATTPGDEAKAERTRLTQMLRGLQPHLAHQRVLTVRTKQAERRRQVAAWEAEVARRRAAAQANTPAPGTSAPVGPTLSPIMRQPEPMALIPGAMLTARQREQTHARNAEILGEQLLGRARRGGGDRKALWAEVDQWAAIVTTRLGEIQRHAPVAGGRLEASFHRIRSELDTLRARE